MARDHVQRRLARGGCTAAIPGAEGSEVTTVVGAGWWRHGAMLVGASALACSKPGGATEGPAEEAGAAGEVEVAKAVAKPEPRMSRNGCPESMVPVEGNETLPPFCIGETEVSVREFRRCVEAKACREFDLKWDIDDPTKATWLLGDESMPINYVDEEQAKQYCAFVGGRLPTADEWIWALGSARGWVFPWGNEFSNDKDRYCGCWQQPGQSLGESILCPTKQHPDDRTLQGAYDMAGSAKEIIGPNENGEYGVMIGVAPLGIPTSEISTKRRTVTNGPMPWYAGPLATWGASTSFRCVAKPRGEAPSAIELRDDR